MLGSKNTESQCGGPRSKTKTKSENRDKTEMDVADLLTDLTSPQFLLVCPHQYFTINPKVPQLHQSHCLNLKK